MASERGKTAISKFPERLMPSGRRTAEVFSEKEGVSLNQFINVAVAEKLAHLEHEEWARNRKQPTNELAGKAGRGKSRTGKSRTDGNDPKGKAVKQKSNSCSCIGAISVCPAFLPSVLLFSLLFSCSK